MAGADPGGKAGKQRASLSRLEISQLIRAIAADQRPDLATADDKQHAEALIETIMALRDEQAKLESIGRNRAAQLEASLSLRDGARLKWAAAAGWTFGDRLFVVIVIVVLAATVILLQLIGKLSDPAWIAGFHALFGSTPH